MGETNIEWADSVWNPVRGCTKVSPGCAHCYAETFAERFRGVPNHPYTQGFDLRLVPEKLAEPLKWKKPKRIFVNSMSDLFQDGVPDDFIDRVFAVMALSSQHTFQVLTKRAERMRDYVTAASAKYGDRRAGIEVAMFDIGGDNDARTIPNAGWPLPNVWLGVSVENQHFVDERIPLLLQTRAAVRFISAEPLLEHIDIRPYMPNALWNDISSLKHTELDWCIVGGESGNGARPFNIEWARSIIAHCAAANVPVFMKQLGKMPYEGTDPYELDIDKGHGGDPVEWPADIRVRQFPEITK